MADSTEECLRHASAAINIALVPDHIYPICLSLVRKTTITYWLVHLSKVYRARNVMMDLHWKHANNEPHFSYHSGTGIFGLEYKATKTPGQNSFDYCDEKLLIPIHKIAA